MQIVPGVHSVFWLHSMSNVPMFLCIWSVSESVLKYTLLTSISTQSQNKKSMPMALLFYRIYIL